MKKLILVLTLSLFITGIKAQTYTDFVKKASFVKEGKKNGGYSCSNCSDESQRTYTLDGADYPFIISNLKVENDLVQSFNITYLRKQSNMGVIPNDPANPTCWVMAKPYQQIYFVMYKEWLVFLSDDPVNPNFYIEAWYQIGGLSAKEKLQANLAAMKNALKPPFTKEDIAADCKVFVDAKKSADGNAKANAEAKAAEHKAKYSIKDKKVTKIEIVPTYPKDFCVQSKYKFGVVATLADGSQIKTKELGGEGYLEDYAILINGEKPSYYSQEHEVSTQLNKSKGDYILIEANSVHHADLKKVNVKMVLTYNQPLKLNYSGMGTTGQGDNADNIRVEVKNVKHSETGETILEYRISTSKGLDKTVRLQPTQVLELSANGGRSGSTIMGGGKNLRGGDAGNITLYVDPAVGENYRFEYSNIGGKGGSDSKYLNAADGRDGTFTKKVQAIP